MVLKEKIIQCFNGQAGSYDTAVDIQPIVAERLAACLTGVEAAAILELGCGTGIFSQLLVNCFPNAHIEMTDIAPAMLSLCHQRFDPNPKIAVYHMDGENLQSEKKYNLIISNMTLHWFSDVEKSLRAMKAKLAPGGKIIFSMLGQKSLSTWREICEENQVSVSTPVFLSHQHLQSTLPEFEWQTEILFQNYDSAHEFFKTLKEIGAYATHRNHAPLSAGVMRRMLRYLDASMPHPFNMSYEIIYGEYTQS